MEIRSPGQNLAAAEAPAAPIDCADQSAVARLYQRFAGAALSKLHHIVGQLSVAEEILQEIFIRMWQKAPVFPNEQAAYVWIYRACHNAGIDCLRSGRRRFESALLDVDLGVETFAEQPDVKIMVRGLLQHYTARQASILVCLHVDGMSQEETAEFLDLSRRTVIRELVKIRTRTARLIEKDRKESHV